MSEIDLSPMRAAMVASQLRTNAVNDPAIVAAMEAVPREMFVPADRAAVAYVDVPVPVGEGRFLNAPLVTGRMLIEAGVGPESKVLIIGAATGYSAAVLSRLAGHVVALEENATLAGQAKANLSSASNVSVETGPLNAGHAAGAPYDAIIIEGAVEQVPAAIWTQLREGGTLVTGEAQGNVTHIARGRRVGNSHALVQVMEIQVVALPGFAVKKGFSF